MGWVLMQYYRSKHREQPSSLRLLLIGGMGFVVKMVPYAVFPTLNFNPATHW